jgi:hypothetical protein
MPIAVPIPDFPQELTAWVKLPTAPRNPPSVADVAAGIKLKHDVLSARGQSHHCQEHRRS